MYKKFLFLTVVALFPTLGQSVNLTNWYLRGMSGYNDLHIPASHNIRIEANAGFLFGAAIGYKVANTSRFEFEVTYRNNSLEKLKINNEFDRFVFDLEGEVSSLASMGNLIFDLPFKLPIIPYVGGGFGVQRAWGQACIPVLNGTENEVRMKLRETKIVYQVLAGVNLAHNRWIELGLEYHFLDALADPDSDCNHSVAISCRKTF